MKYSFFLIVFVLVFCGCGKQYTCSCYDEDGNPTQDHVYRYWSKGEANKRCRHYENTYNTPDGYCEIEN